MSFQKYLTSRNTKKFGKCYRDNDEASVGTELGDAINHALRNSENLVVIFSKETPKSEWVTKEIERY